MGDEVSNSKKGVVIYTQLDANICGRCEEKLIEDSGKWYCPRLGKVISTPKRIIGRRMENGEIPMDCPYFREYLRQCSEEETTLNESPFSKNDFPR